MFRAGKARVLVVGFAMLTSGLVSGAQAQENRGCTYRSNWRTVDAFQLTRDVFAAANGITANDRTIYAVGVAQTSTDETSGHWIVRRSRNNGATWQIVDDYKKGDRQSEARAVAIDPKSGAIYVAGFAVETAPAPITILSNWIVRKSSDGGATWSVVDGVAQGDAESIAIDGAGVVYAAGTITFPGSPIPKWAVRRSADGGVTWKTVDTFPVDGPGGAMAIVASSDGKVFAGGSSATPAARAWAVRFSPDGVSNWQVVDRFSFSANRGSIALGGALREFGLTGSKVAFVGTATDLGGGVHWVTREASVAKPAAWTTIDEFTVGESPATAEGAAYDARGELFVTGRVMRSDLPDLCVTRHNTTTSDSLSGTPAPEADDETSGLSVALNDRSDVFTSGRIARRISTRWIVRRLKCSPRRGD